MQNHPKRALMLAGGGLKVAFQAGVLQVWLDEAGLNFDLADGASGGTFNLAMWCQGMNGTQIADNWRKLDPQLGVAFNWSEFAKLIYARSLFTLDKYRQNVFTTWGLDWGKIRASQREATFNVYNFTRHELEIVTPDRMSEDYLAACVSLPMWFPPVQINGDHYIDPVYVTDANLEEAIRRGADELWIIWTVSEKGEWHDGFVATYFQIIETAANGHFKRALSRIEVNNLAIARGGHGEFGRHIEVKLLKAEVPLHYLVDFSQDRLTEAVNLGVQHARKWCVKQSITLQPTAGYFPTAVHTAQTRLAFTEEMKGYITLGESDYDRGFRQGRASNTFLMFHLTIQVEGVNRFVTDPAHEAATTGYVQCDALGGRLSVNRGVFNLFTHEDDPARKQMLYRLWLRDSAGQPLTFTGFKDVRDDEGFDVWQDTTTLFVRVLRGHVEAVGDAQAEIIAAGIINIYVMDFLKQLTTFEVEAPTLADKSAAFTSFGKLFLGKLWDVYARELLAYGPF
jgi:predicted acylesterase/phospholipase RssA